LLQLFVSLHVRQPDKYRTAVVLDAVDDDPIDQLTAKTTKPETLELANHEPHT
jgi:hypothetical protein